MKKIQRTNLTNVKQILANVEHQFSVGAQFSDAGVTAVNGRKVILAGTPVGGSTSILADEKAVVKVVADATVQGIALHDVDVTDGTENGTVLIWGFVNTNRLDKAVTIPDAVKTALNGKVTFLARNK